MAEVKKSTKRLRYASKDISGGSVAPGRLAATTGGCLSSQSERVPQESERISRLPGAGTGVSLAAYLSLECWHRVVSAAMKCRPQSKRCFLTEYIV